MKQKPLVFLIPEDSDDLFVDVDFMQAWRKSTPFNENYYQGLVLGFGKNIFVFAKDSVEFLNKEKECIS